MKYKSITAYLIVILFALCNSLFAEENSSQTVIDKLTKDIGVNNCKSILLHGTSGSLRIFFEKTKNNPYESSKIDIKYNGQEFSTRSVNIMIVTKDNDLIFIKNGDKIYAQAEKKTSNEHCDITVKDVNFDFDNNIVRIEKDNKKLTAKKISYTYGENHIYVYSGKKKEYREF